jgi:hypothetical protein
MSTTSAYPLDKLQVARENESVTLPGQQDGKQHEKDEDNEKKEMAK